MIQQNTPTARLLPKIHGESRIKKWNSLRRPSAKLNSKLREMRVKNNPNAKSLLCQPSSLRVRRRERKASSGRGPAMETRASGSSVLNSCSNSASSGSLLMYASTKVRVSGLSSPRTYKGNRSATTLRGTFIITFIERLQAQAALDELSP